MKRFVSASLKVAALAGLASLCLFGLLAPENPRFDLPEYEGTLSNYTREVFAIVATNGNVLDFPMPPKN